MYKCITGVFCKMFSQTGAWYHVCWI